MLPHKKFLFLAIGAQGYKILVFKTPIRVIKKQETNL